ncbi:hypothetical protein [Photobacterium sanguinicancri]|uniref:RiboL-PSP-HEPN domain-containing protein n=1 Tax=Photobacterium sanguinicancri TaxID=875932 RepID=A0ABX4FTZ3_9GAMM|nr:hypothetical protein [Photobacterium sanguinicancri]OZS42293.1 hypothetical protein ASV53_19220 [Photobacterium sanguinicancri]
MSSTTDYILGLQEEEMRIWICEHLDDEDADEETPGWDELAQEWAYMQASQEEPVEFFDWYVSHSYSDIQRTFHFQIHKLRDLMDMQVAVFHEETFYKMSYAHAVTLMESFLADTVRSLILADNKYFINAINKVEALKECKFTISEIAKQKDGAQGFAITELSKIMYHNIPKVREILKAILGKSLSIDISNVCRITSLRHDIVHRDGKTTDGKLIKVDREITMEAIGHIEAFVNNVSEEIHNHQNA